MLAKCQAIVDGLYQQLVGECPYEHQRLAFHALSVGKSIILRAPTGSGKTEAVFLPYLTVRGRMLPHRLIYALPLRALANEQVKRLQDYAQRAGTPLEVRLQHGRHPDSVLFWADTVVTTLDQVVTSYACCPLTLGVRHGNVPAGAVAGSFLVFDEVHVFEPEVGLQCVRILCERSQRLGLPFAVISATLPDAVLDFWKKKLGAERIDVSGKTSLVARRVTLRYCRVQLSPQVVAEALKHDQPQRVILVCNTVERAISLFEALQSAVARRLGYECELLHSRFLPEDRKSKEDWVMARFGKNSSVSVPSLLVATQVVEVGLDISCELLLSELAPADALIQRAGRCARWGGKGTVLVFKVPNSRPYRDDLMERTARAIISLDGKLLTWAQEKRLVNQVLNDAYRKAICDEARNSILARLSVAAFGGHRRLAQRAVRNIGSVDVTIHDNPNNLGNKIWQLPTISVHHSVVRGWVAKAKGKAWLVREEREPNDFCLTVTVHPLPSKEDVPFPARIVFSPTVLAYDPKLGLKLGQGKRFELESSKQRDKLERRRRRENWVQHVQNVMTALERDVLPKEQLALDALARALKVCKEQVLCAAKLAIMLHDLGKLNVEWQEKAGVLRSASISELLAHTDEREYINFPPHATVSAYAVWLPLTNGAWLPRVLGRAVVLAIAHHHSVRAREVPKFQLHSQWRKAVQQVARNMAVSLSLNDVCDSQPSNTTLPESMPPFEDELLYTAYVLISRWLRLADRIATGGGRETIVRYEDWFGHI